jgi:polar amino acid transport system substrate-binding protein
MRIIFFVISIVMLNVECFAIDGVVTVACRRMVYLAETSDKGLLIDVLKEIETRSGLKLKIDVIPFSRATGEFLKGNYDVLCPASSASLDIASGKFLMSREIFERQEIVFMRKTDKLLNKLEEFKGLKIGVLAGAYTYLHDIIDNKSFIIEQNSNTISNMKKLLAGRIDAVIAEKFNGLSGLREADPDKKIAYDLDRPLKRMKDFFAMHNDVRGKEINDAFSKAIDQLTTEGLLEKIWSI